MASGTQIDTDRRANRRRIFYAIYVAVVAGWIGVMWMFLGMADPPGPDSSGVPAVGVAGHLFLFGVLGLLISAGALILHRPGRVTLALIAALLVGGLVGILTESYQLTVGARSGTLEDFFTDVIGTAGGATLAWMVRLWQARRGRFQVS